MENRNLNKVKYKTENFFNWIFKDANSFFIPFFQREYEWGKPQIKNLFWDIVYRSQDQNEHSLGFVQINNKENDIDKKIRVIDGQQRITTFLIFTKVFKDLIVENFQEKAESMHDLKKIKDISPFKFDSNFYGDKLITFLKNPLLEKTKDPITMVFNQNYKTLKDVIIKESKNNKDVIFEWWNAFKDYFFVGILEWKIEKTQAELEIFKNLNSKNKPLSTHDLVKVYLINKLDDEYFIKREIEQKIDKPFSKNFGNISKLGERFYKNYITYYCFLHNTKQIDNSLAENFKYHFINKGKSIDREPWDWDYFQNKVNELSKFFIFEKMLRGKSLNGTDLTHLEIIKKYNIHLIDFRTNSMFPLLFYLLDNYLEVDVLTIPYIKKFVSKVHEPQSFAKALEILELYRVRHHGFTNNDSLTDYFGKLIPFLDQYSHRKDFLQLIPQKIWEYFTKPEGNHIPSQQNFASRLKSEQLQQWAQRIILEKIEHFYLNYNNSQKEITYRTIKQNKPSVEHIAPQTPTEYWEENVNAKGDEYQRRINLIGNLIWIPFKINSRVSNWDFNQKIREYKRELIDQNVKIFSLIGDYNKVENLPKVKPLEEYGEEWTWNTIEQRTEELATIIANHVFKDPKF